MLEVFLKAEVELVEIYGTVQITHMQRHMINTLVVHLWPLVQHTISSRGFAKAPFPGCLIDMRKIDTEMCG